MIFETGYLYHIYNQGNNRCKVFLNQDNYFYFLKKVKTFISPYADLLAWCLMPNHFHFMVLVNKVEMECSSIKEAVQDKNRQKPRSLNDSIGIMLRSYTRAFNIQNGLSGKLFREKTKAECINCPKGLTPSFFIQDGITKMNITNPEMQYQQICFDYIHQNPVRAGLVKRATDWEYSSARDYVGLRKGKLVNKTLAEKYVDVSGRQVTP